MGRTKPKVCVIGGGIIGLTTANMLQDKLEGIKITLYAEKLLTETTSDGAAGIFRPSTSFQGSTKEQTKKWMKDSFDFYNAYLKDQDHAKTIGIKELSGYLLSSKDPKMVENPFMKDLSSVYRSCRQEELDQFPGPPLYGTFLSTILIEGRLYMPYLQDKFLSKGGNLIKRRIEDFEELVNEGFDLILNCSGLGARKLCNDHSVVAVRGQVFKVDAPWQKHFVYNDYGAYIIPGFDAVTVGGVRQLEDYNTQVDETDSTAIWKRCTAILPSLKDAKVIREWVGLRPHRSFVRVEPEMIRFPSGKSLIVVHNYGHGGYGVMTAPGTSLEAADIAQKLVQDNHMPIKAKI